MGRALQWSGDRRALVTDRSAHAHQLARVESGLPGAKKLCERGYSACSAKAGQHNSRCVCESHGGNKVAGSGSLGPGDVVVGLGKRPDVVCNSRSRIDKHPSGQVFAGFSGQGRVATEPLSFPVIEQLDRQCIDSRSVCVSSECSAGGVCLLAPRTRGHGSGCSKHSLGQPGASVCLSPLQPSVQGTEKSPVRRSNSDFDSSSLEVSGLVPQGVEHVVRESGSPTTELGSAVPATQQETPSAVARSDACRVANIRRQLQGRGLSAGASDLILSAWRESTSRQYQSAWAQWASWCDRREIDPVCGSIESVVEYLEWMFRQNYSYMSIGVARSAISSVHLPVDHCNVGSHPLVSKLMRGVFHKRPPCPRYVSTWDVSRVLEYLLHCCPANSLSLKQLSHKLVTLAALVSADRGQTLAALDLRFMKNVETVFWTIPTLLKTSRPGKPARRCFWAAFPQDRRLCAFTYLKEYLRRTSSLRKEGGGEQKLFISYRRPHRPVGSATLARWVKSVLGTAGVDTATFSAHSTRGASTSAAAAAGVSLHSIMKAADWSRESTFLKYYRRDNNQHTFGQAVLSTALKSA
ncbi:LOW QUALITY PROTEIN: uncharacterized protein LOC144907036 [Branchiostoma floridae x Branchiostoma belcheri]